MLLSAHNLFYYCGWRVSSLDVVPYTYVIFKNYVNQDQTRSELSHVEIKQMSLK